MGTFLKECFEPFQGLYCILDSIGLFLFEDLFVQRKSIFFKGYFNREKIDTLIGKGRLFSIAIGVRKVIRV